MNGVNLPADFFQPELQIAVAVVEAGAAMTNALLDGELGHCSSSLSAPA